MQAKLTIFTDPVEWDRKQVVRYCAKDLTGQESTPCDGDYGGPLMYYMNNKYYLYGLVSFGSNEESSHKKSYYSSTNEPTFYTIVPKYLEWISETRNIY